VGADEHGLSSDALLTSPDKGLQAAGEGPAHPERGQGGHLPSSDPGTVTV
jgi:hypothetical protein